MAWATNRAGVVAKDIRIGTRNAALLHLPLGEANVQIAGVYLDDMSEETRLTQLESLLQQLPYRDAPTVIAGDMNMLRPRPLVRQAGLAQTLGDMVVRGVSALPAPLLNKHGDDPSLSARIRGMHDGRRAYLRLHAAGFRDADAAHSRSTIPEGMSLPRTNRALPPVACLDYIWGQHVTLANPVVHSSEGASDHRPVSCAINIPARENQISKSDKRP